MEMILQKLRGANLKLKPSKCFFLQTSVKFLGHPVSSKGLETDGDKTRLIEEWPVPTSLKQLRGFLRLAGYYRRFVKDFSKKAALLNDLLKKNSRFQWTPACQSAFDELKAALQSPPVLALPSETRMYSLDTDASDKSIGAVLSQVQDGQDKVIAYAGRALSKNEMNYCAYRKELLADVYFTRHFKQYLLSSRFLLRTDNSSVSWLKKTPEPLGRNARWLEQLGEFTLTVQHRKSTSHANADAISRHPCLNKPSCIACHPEKATAQLTARGAHVRVTSEPEQTGEGRNDSSDAAGGGAADHPTLNSDQQQHLTVAPETEVITDNADGNTAPDMQQYEWDADSLIAGQRNDPDIKVIISLLERSTDKPAWKDVELQSADVKSLYTEWPLLAFRSGLLCRQWTELTGRIVWQIVLPRPHRAEFVKIVHSGMTGGHLGRHKTEEQVRQRAYWPGWKRQVETELKRCQQCAQYHRGRGPKQTPLTPFCSGYPWEMISFDITGPHTKSARGNQYMITVIDVFSKWAEAFPVKNHTAPTVAKVLVDQVFSRWGTPARILMDNGAEFHSDLLSEVCKLLGVDKLHTTTYHRQTNGCVERFHLTLNRMLGKVVSENQKDWDSHLPAVLVPIELQSTNLLASRRMSLSWVKNHVCPLTLFSAISQKIDLSTKRTLTMSKICENGL